jgi:hypothetical protein
VPLAICNNNHTLGLSGQLTLSNRNKREKNATGHTALHLLRPIANKGLLMIPRYSHKDMAQIWAPETRFRIWFEIEAHAADKMAELGIVPKEAAAVIWEKGRNAEFDVARIDEIESVTKHDVIALRSSGQKRALFIRV